MSKKSKAPTLQDVAHLAGVSRATASLVLRNSPKVSEKTRKKVLQAVTECGYRYNRVAASFRSQRTHTIALILPDINNPFFAEMIEGIEIILDRAQYTLHLYLSHEDPQKELLILDRINEYRADGIIICPTHGKGEALLAKIHDLDMKYVFVTRRPMHKKVYYVGADNIKGSEISVDYLVNKGCSLFVYIGGQKELSARNERVKGYCDALDKHKIQYNKDLILESEISIRGGYLLASRLIETKEIDAIVCYNDIVAFGVSLAISMKKKQQISVIGFDNLKQAEFWVPPLTTVNIFPKELGKQTAELLFAQFSDEYLDIREILLEPILCVRGSA